MIGLSKSRILAYRQCPKRLWLQVNRPELAIDDAGATGRMMAGSQVGEIARTLYPNGVLIDGADLSQAIEDTTSALSRGSESIFEATFKASGVLVRADLLFPEDAGCRLTEVKSSTSVKPYHLEDAAVQAWVTEQAGVTVSRIEIAHIDNGFIYPGDGDYQGLFSHADVTAEVRASLPEVPRWIAGAQATLAGDEPDLPAGSQCTAPFACPFFGYCSPPDGDDAYPPEILPYARTLPAQLRAEGYDDLRQIPAGRLTNPKHVRVWRVTKKGAPELDPQAALALQDLPYPRYYLDFETIAFAIPRWAGTRPYQQIPFQWSCHIEVQPGMMEHRSFLAVDASDPRRAFAESLLAAVKGPRAGTAGPIFVYNIAFERSRVLELARAFPDLASALEAIAERLVDLLPIVREHYYHPAMRGSWSIKAVLPTIAPHLAYDRLQVADGSMAQEAFAEIIDPTTSHPRRQELREALLEYCALDTWAMVELARFLEQRPR